MRKQRRPQTSKRVRWAQTGGVYASPRLASIMEAQDTPTWRAQDPTTMCSNLLSRVA